jgi:hypothetical protein
MTNGILRAMVFGIALLLTGISVDGPAVGGGVSTSGRINVQLYPQHTYVAPAGLCTLEVFVTAPADSLACMECFVQYDNTLLTLVSVEEGTLFSQAPYPTFFIWENVAPDTLSAVDCVLGYQSYFLPPGDFVRLVFQAGQPGVAGVHIASIQVWDIDREEVFPVVDPAAWIHIGTPPTGVTTPSPAGSFDCYPNPFNPSTTLQLNLPFGETNDIEVSIYSPSGAKIATLFEGDCNTGNCRFVWRGIDGSGQRVASGVYLAVARTRSEVYTTKLVLIE